MRPIVHRHGGGGRDQRARWSREAGLIGCKPGVCRMQPISLQLEASGRRALRPKKTNRVAHARFSECNAGGPIPCRTSCQAEGTVRCWSGKDRRGQVAQTSRRMPSRGDSALRPPDGRARLAGATRAARSANNFELPLDGIAGHNQSTWRVRKPRHRPGTVAPATDKARRHWTAGPRPRSSIDN
jgi:hypothetical protein